MLTELIVKDYAIAHALHTEWRCGMTAITGETGAGKSILLDAIGLALGDRADPEAIATHAERAEISVRFDINNINSAQRWLQENGFPEEEQQLLLKRVIMREGRSRAWINGQAATLAQLREIGETLIDIHSQHEHQSLLKKDSHAALLDCFGQHSELQKNVQHLSRQWRQLQQEIEQLAGASRDQSAQIQLLQYQVEELDRAAPQDGEDERLSQEQKLLCSVDTQQLHAQQLLELLSEGDTFNALLALRQAQQVLSRSPLASQLPSALEMLDAAQIQLSELVSDIEHTSSTLNGDPARLQQVEQRLQLLHELARKHRVSAAELPQAHRDLQQQLDALKNADQQIIALKQQQQALAEQWRLAARQLTRAREKTAKSLAVAVNEQLGLLRMVHCRFEVALNPHNDDEPHSGGAESVEFLISTQPDAPARSLAKVASGGELSRISLAIQVVIAEVSRIPTLVFDEVDVGIGGATATVVGHMLRSLGERGQILCVTHQAPVAAQAHNHLQVQKKARGRRLETNLCQLSADKRIDEIARMIGGEYVSEQSRAHAREMLSQRITH